MTIYYKVPDRYSMLQLYNITVCRVDTRQKIKREMDGKCAKKETAKNGTAATIRQPDGIK